MSYNIKEKLSSMVIGIKFDNNFKIADLRGTIIDNIANSGEDYINKYELDRLENNRKHLIHLINKESKNNLIINRTDMILKINNENDKYILHEEKPNIIKSYKKVLIKNIMEEYNIKNIQRIGIIYNYNIKNKNIVKYIDKKIDANFSVYENKNINDYAIKYSNPKEDNISAVSKEKDDYYNHIIKFIKNKEKENNYIVLSVDYQKYFNPQRNSRNIDIIKHKNKFDTFIESNINKWLNKIIDQFNDKKGQ